MKPQQSEVSRMNPKLRIMTICLIEKLAEYPEYTAWLGIEGGLTGETSDQAAFLKKP